MAGSLDTDNFYPNWWLIQLFERHWVARYCFLQYWFVTRGAWTHVTTLCCCLGSTIISRWRVYRNTVIEPYFHELHVSGIVLFLHALTKIGIAIRSYCWYTAHQLYTCLKLKFNDCNMRAAARNSPSAGQEWTKLNRRRRLTTDQRRASLVCAITPYQSPNTTFNIWTRQWEGRLWMNFSY